MVLFLPGDHNLSLSLAISKPEERHCRVRWLAATYHTETFPDMQEKWARTFEDVARQVAI